MASTQGGIGHRHHHGGGIQGDWVGDSDTCRIEGVLMSGCSKVTVQQKVRVLSAMEVPVLPTLTTGSAGTGVGEKWTWIEKTLEDCTY